MDTSTLADSTQENQNETIGQDDTEFDDCELMKALVDSLFVYFLILSVVLTGVLSFVVRRVRLYPNCLWGRPGVLQPVNFVDEVYRRWAYAACFVLVTNDIMQIFLGESKLNLLPTDDKEWMRKFGFVRVFVKLLEALAVSFVYYPLLACINHRRFIAANVVGILYLIPWITLYSLVFRFCPITKEGSWLQSMDYITTIPMYIAFYVIGLSYVLDLVKNIIRKVKRRSTVALSAKSSNRSERKSGGYAISHHFEYVGNLLRVRKSSAPEETENGLKLKAKRIILRAKYEKIMGFRYSTRLVCCTTTAATLIIWIVVVISALVDAALSLVGPICANVESVEFLKRLCDYIRTVGILFHVANAMSGAVVLMFMAHTLVVYKQRWHQLLRGDHSWHIYGTTIDSPPSTLLNGLKYAGFQVAYAAWGWAVLTIILWIVYMFLAFAFFIPLMRGEVNSWFITLLKNLWPTVVLGIVIALIQKLICKFLFLQDRGSVLAFDNRRLYNAASYYFLVLNVIIGFFACLKRIIIPLVLGILFLSRLDQPLIMKGFEANDPGYVSFVSMLLVDLYHNHPVVKAFVELLLKVRREDAALTGVNGGIDTLSGERLRRSRLIRNRWWKTVTLANNPSLVLKALEQRLRDERNNAVQGIIQPPSSTNEKWAAIEMQRVPEVYNNWQSSRI